MAAVSLDEETSKKVLRQVEFYFSDSNLPRDKFLKKSIGESEDGMVSLALICSFTRMRNHLSLGNLKPEDISDDTLEAVTDVLRKSTCLQISEDGKKVGRTIELSKAEELIEQVDVRTIAASPLEYNVKLEDVESFFTQFGKVNSVRLPHHVADKRLFSGTALVEFSTQEEVDKILSQNIVYGGVQLEFKSKKEFDAERSEKIEELKNSRRGSNHKNSDDEPSYPKGLIVAFTLKSKEEKRDEEGNGSEQQANDEPVVLKADEEKHSKNIDQETSNKESDVSDITAQKNEDVGRSNGNEEGDHENKFSGVSLDESKKCKLNASDCKNDNNVVMREDLKTLFNKFGTVKYVDFNMGEKSGYIRFGEPEAAQKVRAAAVLTEEGLSVKNFILILEPVTGEAEREYWSLLSCNKDKIRGNKGSQGRRGGKNFRGGRDSRPNKFRKVSR
ncbi:hypothetical protein SAY87_030584 [Trapa incisa]|uniref:La protein 1 n=1 Tax=Trapa incisa TaxID=236973 RepID=A0AAN7KNH5_9MYRT|nr:hypothetical protein SAY87_030584 [Trapa incisa]